MKAFVDHTRVIGLDFLDNGRVRVRFANGREYEALPNLVPVIGALVTITCEIDSAPIPPAPARSSNEKNEDGGKDR